MSVWRQTVVFPLCACLLATGAVQAAQNQVLSVSSSETKWFREMLSGQRINAFLADGTQLRGRVKEVQDGLLTVDIKKSIGPSSVPRGLHDIPMNRLSTVQFTRYKGNKRVLLGTAFTVGGLGLGGGVATATRGDRSGGAYLTVALLGIGMGVLGYLWGRNKDKKNITVKLEHPPRSVSEYSKSPQYIVVIGRYEY